MYGDLKTQLQSELDEIRAAGLYKGERVIDTPQAARVGVGRTAPVLNMCANNYLGLASHPEVIAAAHEALDKWGYGLASVRFICGTQKIHKQLEEKLSEFLGTEDTILYTSCFDANGGLFETLLGPEDAVISDELNHASIIDGVRLCKAKRFRYKNNDMADLATQLEEAKGSRRILIVTDGVFSMRGDFADLSAITEIAASHDGDYPENVVVVVDDSHGIGAYGQMGRGTEEVTGGVADVLIGTLGKAFGVNGGYVTGSETLSTYLREKGPMYIYSNPITPGEAAAAEMAVTILDSPEGIELLEHLAQMTARFESGLVDRGFETIPGPHPVVPLMVRDTGRTSALVDHLFGNGILATGLNYPVVPRGDEEIRFQVNADHTPADIDYVLGVLTEFGG